MNKEREKSGIKIWRKREKMESEGEKNEKKICIQCTYVRTIDDVVDDDVAADTRLSKTHFLDVV